MRSKRGELVPVAEVVSGLGRAGGRDPRSHASRVAPLHPRRSSKPACLGKRSGRRSRLHGADDGAVLPAAHQPWRPPPVQAKERPVQAHHDGHRDHKLPFGNLARLILAWVCSEAVRTQSRELVLGESLAEFMRTLGIYNSGGQPQTRLRNQMKRLFGCTVSMIYEDEHGEARMSSLVADRAEFWWNERKPDEPVLWDSKIRLGEDFFNEIIQHPVPLDMNILAALKRSALGLDFYLWLNYRTFALRAPLRLSWRAVYRQFGADPTKASDKRTVDNFRTDSYASSRRSSSPGRTCTTRRPRAS